MYKAKSQAKYLANLNKNLQEGELILLGDFAENCNLTVQGEILGYYQNKQSCTLHPIVIYVNTGGKLASHAFVFSQMTLNMISAYCGKF